MAVSYAPCRAYGLGGVVYPALARWAILCRPAGSSRQPKTVLTAGMLRYGHDYWAGEIQPAVWGIPSRR